MYIFYSVILFTLLTVLTYIAKPELIFCKSGDGDDTKQHVIYVSVMVVYAALCTFVFAFMELISN